MTMRIVWRTGEYSTSEMLVNMSAATLEEFYPAIAITTLMRIIRDPSLSQHHTMVVQAITFIFKSLGIKCVPYISQVMPAYLQVIRSSDTIFREVGPQHFHFVTGMLKTKAKLRSRLFSIKAYTLWTSCLSFKQYR